MAYTKKQFRDWVLDECAATQGVRFDSNPGGIVDRKIGGAHDRLWADLLNAAEPGVLRGGIRTPATDAEGLVALSVLSDRTDPDAAQRLYRIISVDINGIPYADGTARSAELTRRWSAAAVVGAAGVRDARLWWVFGSAIYALPKAAAVATSILVNHRPTRFDQLSSEAVVLEFPDGYEQVLAYRAAAEVLMKGSEETQASLELRAAAEPLWQDMMADLGRATTTPDRVQYDDSPEEWAG